LWNAPWRDGVDALTAQSIASTVRVFVPCSDAEGLVQKPAGAKSLKARQNEAISAADAAAMYSLRSQERGRVDAAAAAAAGNKQAAAPQKPALPADWGFLQ
jgi:hypothetical protein